MKSYFRSWRKGIAATAAAVLAATGTVTAVAQAANEEPDHDVTYNVIPGESTNGSLNPDTKLIADADVKSLGWKNTIKFYGEVVDYASWSRYEGQEVGINFAGLLGVEYNGKQTFALCTEQKMGPFNESDSAYNLSRPALVKDGLIQGRADDNYLSQDQLRQAAKLMDFVSAGKYALPSNPFGIDIDKMSKDVGVANVNAAYWPAAMELAMWSITEGSNLSFDRGYLDMATYDGRTMEVPNTDPGSLGPASVPLRVRVDLSKTRYFDANTQQNGGLVGNPPSDADFYDLVQRFLIIAGKESLTEQQLQDPTYANIANYVEGEVPSPSVLSVAVDADASVAVQKANTADVNYTIVFDRPSLFDERGNEVTDFSYEVVGVSDVIANDNDGRVTLEFTAPNNENGYTIKATGEGVTPVYLAFNNYEKGQAGNNVNPMGQDMFTSSLVPATQVATQAFTIVPAEMATTVTANNVAAKPVEKDAEGNVTFAGEAADVTVKADVSAVPVTDSIATENFAEGSYEFTGEVRQVGGNVDESPVVKSASAIFEYTTNGWEVVSGAGSVSDGNPVLDFGDVPVEDGKSYVVFENAYRVDESGARLNADRTVVAEGETATAYATHEDLSAQSQTFNVSKEKSTSTSQTTSATTTVTSTTTEPNKPASSTTSETTTTEVKVVEKTMKTTVEANDESSTKDAAVKVSVNDAAAGVKVVDTIDYSGFEAGKTYTFVGSLVDVTKGANNEVVAIAGTPTTIPGEAGTAVDGSVEVDFGTVSGLKAGHTYVVFERAYEGEVPVPAKPSTDNGTSNLPGVPSEPVVTHADADDKAQTVVVDKDMKTSVAANGEKAADAEKALTISEEAASAKDGVAVVDTIDYYGFIAGETYTFVGSLVDVTDGNKVVRVAGTTTTIPGEAGQPVDGKVEIDFGLVTGLEKGHTYVVFERAYEGIVEVPSEVPSVDNGSSNEPGFPSNPVVTHADSNDKAQTIVVGLSMKTTVAANGKASSNEESVVVADEDSASVAVVDTIDYEGFEVGKTYTFVGSLVDVTADAGNKVVAVAATTQTLATENGSVPVDFGTLTNLEIGHTYVVFERAYEGSVEIPSVPTNDEGGREFPGTEGNENFKAVSVHVDANDKAQTFLVGKGMKTTVEANGESSTKDAAVTVTADAAEAESGVKVVDTIDYYGFDAAKTYTFFGSLVDVTENNKVVAVAATTVAPLGSARGSVKVDFGNVKGLKAGHTYVVFERAYEGAVEVPSEVPSTDNGTSEEPGFPANPVVTHADANDKAQTVVVGPRDEVPPTPPAGSSVNPWWLLIPIVPAVIGGIAALAGGSSTPPAPEAVKTPEAPATAQRPMLAQTGANVLWVVLAGLIAAIAGGLLITRRKNA